MDKKLKMLVNAEIQSFNVNSGKITKISKVHNLVVNSGLDEIIDNGLSNVTTMAIGTDNTAVQATDTALGTQVASDSVVYSNEGTGIRLFDKTFTFGSGDEYTIVEAGLFAGATMFNRLVFSGHDVDVNNGVRVKITVTLVTA